jgi:glucokinase
LLDPYWDELEGVGLGVAGLVQVASGTLVEAPNLSSSWLALPLRRYLENRWKKAVRVDNDAHVILLGEVVYGKAGGAEPVVLLTLGTGVGGAMMVGGRLVRGHNGMAGEWGHAVLVPDGAPCRCGRRGCVEAYLGRDGFLRQVAPWFQRTPLPARNGRLTFEELTRWADQKEPAALRAFEEYGTFLGRALVQVVHILDPELILIGGGLAHAAAHFLPSARTYVREHALGMDRRNLRIEPTTLFEDGGILGAVALFHLEA